MTRALRLLPALTLAAVLTITASAEYELARTVLALPPGIAWALPVAVDSYVLTAFRSGRDVRPALAVMAGALTAAMGAHLVTADRPAGQALPVAVSAPAATGIMIVLVVVAWRVHVLIDQPSATGDSATVTAAATVTESSGVTAPDGVTGHGRVTANPSAPDYRPVTAANASGSADAALGTVTPPSGGVTVPNPGVSVGSAAAPPSPAGAPPHPSDIATAVSDEQILAAITGTAPSIRTLMRDHRIGRGRATRIQQAAQQNHHTTHQKERHDNTRTDDQTSEGESMNGITGRSTEETIQETTKNDENNAKNKGAGSTHTGITDRVGQSRSTLDESHHRSGPLPVGFGDAR